MKNCDEINRFQRTGEWKENRVRITWKQAMAGVVGSRNSWGCSCRRWEMLPAACCAVLFCMSLWVSWHLCSVIWAHSGFLQVWTREEKKKQKNLSTYTKGKKKKSAVECKYIYPSAALISIFHFAQLRTFISEADAALFSAATFTWQLKFSNPSFSGENHVRNVSVCDKLKDAVFLYLVEKTLFSSSSAK